MKIIKVSDTEKFANSARPKTSQKNSQTVRKILLDVQKHGDAAVKKYEKKFGGADIRTLRVSKNEIKQAYSRVKPKEISALKLVKKRLEKTESSLKKQLKQLKITDDGIIIVKSFLPINSVGCYVPGGLAKYPTSLVMCVVPAKVAGVKRIVVVSPPNKNGLIDAHTLVAADLCGVGEIYKTGGAQAIGALSYGTKSIPAIDKVVGPGGSFVTIAKSLIRDNTSIDMIAGPTELGVIADSEADPDLIAWDLFSQAEHSEDTFCFVLTTSQSLAKKVVVSIRKNIANAKRSNIIKKSLKKNGFIAICKNETDLVNLANSLAPEHLEIHTKNLQQISKKITSAGLVLVGKNLPSSASDYVLGSNHVLPTSGFGKTRGSLSVMDFMKIRTEIQISNKELKKISKSMRDLSEAEGLFSHYEAVRRRL